MAQLGMTVEELAGDDGIGISKNTVYDLIAADLIPYVKFGRTIRIPRSAFLRWFDFMAGRHVDLADHEAVRSALRDYEETRKCA